MTPAPGLAFVRRITTVETYGGGAIVIPEQARDKVSNDQWEVVAVGAPEPCDDEDCERFHYDTIDNFRPWGDPNAKFVERRWHEPSDLAPGDWVLCRKRSAVESPEPGLYIVRQDAVVGRFTVTEDAGR